MTQQSQRLWGHATVVAQARPPSHLYVHQYRRIAVQERGAHLLARCPFPPLTPQSTYSRLLFSGQSQEVEDGEGDAAYFFVLMPATCAFGQRG